MNEERFIVFKAKNDRMMFETNIVVDLFTGVQYLQISNGNGTGLTPLLDPEGRPLIYQPDTLCYE